ncbi:transketolase [Candidatus Woesearchaeota archaeon]|nr:transketolase [Candidatus Woesearchaeota archaeon]
MKNVKNLELMANKLRIHSLKSTTTAGSGHPTSCMSCAEIMSTLFFSEMNSNDEFILSKGHAAPILWACYAEAGLIPIKELKNLRKINSTLEGHPTARNKLIKIATGSLGQGLSAGIGMALCKKSMIYVLLGDGETAEGSIWEAANTASYYKLKNLCAIIDLNRLGQSGETMHGHDAKKYSEKFKAFGWNAIIIDGHKIKSILNAIKKAKKSKKPTVIIAKTFKGKGVKLLEDKEGKHGKALDNNQLKTAIQEIGETKVKLKSKIKPKQYYSKSIKSFNFTNYKKQDIIATRDAFGKALVKLGEKNNQVYCIDGDVKNSTRTQEFFNKFPKRSFESFIAEQNMAGIAMGISSQGFVPFLATFAAFLTRAHDFIRMAQYSKSNIKFVGSHCGISIGKDGPSQMGLEDISMFSSMPDSVILYPCDAFSCEKLTYLQAKHNGISYLRTTRAKTPIIYSKKEKFNIGGLKVLKKSKKDNALVICAGITVHESLKAYEILKKKGKNIRIIDLYSVKPIDSKSLLKNAKQCKNNVIVVEDHYTGGIGSIVSSVLGKIRQLSVNHMPCSGSKENLMKKFGIDYNNIVKEAMK